MITDMRWGVNWFWAS